MLSALHGGGTPLYGGGVCNPLSIVPKPSAPPVERDKEVTLLLDADYLSYMIGFICQSKEKDESVSGQIQEDDGMWVYPIDLVKYKVDHEIDKLKDKFASDIMQCYLTPLSGNFRNALGSDTHPYKGGRSSTKPHRYDDIRSHLMESHGATMMDTLEADDVVAIRQRECHRDGIPSVIISNDKDLLGMYGYNFNPRTKYLHWRDPCDAAYNFYMQMVTGDRVDNIPGIPGVGPKGWKKVIDIINDNFHTGLSDFDPNEYINYLHRTVMEMYLDKNCTVDYIVKQGQMLHMKRDANENWNLYYDYYAGYNEDLQGSVSIYPKVPFP